MFDYIPTEVSRGGARQAARKGGFTHLAGTRDKDHFAGKILAHLRCEVARFWRHDERLRQFSTIVKNTHGEFPPWMTAIIKRSVKSGTLGSAAISATSGESEK
jgi:hypothetical protein